jgi:hypothetical protein
MMIVHTPQKEVTDRPATAKRERDHREFLALFFAVLLLVTLGCSKEKMKEAYNSAKSTTETIIRDTKKVVEEKLPESGRMRLEMTPLAAPVTKLDLAMTRMEGRPNMIQIYSYDMTAEYPSRYPAVLLQGSTEIEDPNELVGESIRCAFYYQTDAKSPIAMTKAGSTITITFEELKQEDNALRAKLGIASLESSDGTPARIGGGSLLAVIRGEDS